MHDVLAALTSPEAAVVVPAPGVGEGFWAGGPSAVMADGVLWLAYRLRRPVDQGRGYANVVARSTDFVTVETVAVVTSEQFGAASLERPALVRRPDGGWRLYVSCSTWGSKHWWVEAIDADTPEGLPTGSRTVVLPGQDGVEAWKDVVVHPPAAGVLDGSGAGEWRMWACRHPLDGGDDSADRMTTWYATSDDGLGWHFQGAALSPVDATWDSRGARIADVVYDGDAWWALYDGRRSAEENWRERSGLARGESPGQFVAVAGPQPRHVGTALRYGSVVAVDGGLRAYFETTAEDGSHDLRTVYIPRPSGDSQSE